MFIPGEIYKRTALHQQYGGQQHGGICTPAQFPVVFLFTGERGEQYGYSHGWTDDGIFLYTGEGQVGDMLYRAGNKAIRDHLIDGKDLHLFSYVTTNQMRYVGQMVYLGAQIQFAPDREHKLRQIIVFELAPVALATAPEAYLDRAAVDALYRLDLDRLRASALARCGNSSLIQERKACYRRRSLAIRIYALRRADGICEGCGQPAPFYAADSRPYLEVHHINRPSDGGPNQPEAVVALCPDCHRRAHHALDAADFNQYLSDRARQREAARRPTPKA